MPRAKNKPSLTDLSARRGLPVGSDANSWDTLLLRSPDPSRPADPDAVIDRLLDRHLIGAAKRDVARELWDKSLRTPAGKWALLVKPRGQSWLWLAPSWHDYDLARDLAARAGLVTLVAGYQDTANATFLQAYDGPTTRVKFESTGFNTRPLKDSDTDTRLSGGMHDRAWLHRFKSETDAQAALLKELDAYAPYTGAYSDKNMVGFSAGDGVEFDPQAYERIDLLVFGSAKALDVGEEGQRLKDAIHNGEAAGVTAAIKAGADVTALPETSLPPVQYAIACAGRDPQKWAGALQALLQGGADPSGPPGANPPLCALADEMFLDQEAQFEGLKALLDHGADPAGRCTDGAFRGSTVAHVLALTRGATPLKFLHARGVDVLGLKDAGGLTPLEACEQSVQRMKDRFGVDASPEVHDAMTYLRALQAGTATDDDVEQRLAAERAAEQRRRQEANAAFKGLVETFKTLGEAMQRPTKKNLARVAELSLPSQIHLSPKPRLRWKNAKGRDADAARLEKAGFERIGVFGVKEFPDTRILALLHPGRNVYAAVCEKGDVRWIDLVRYHRNGTRVCVSNAKLMPEAQFEYKKTKSVRLPRAGPAKLSEAMSAEKPPKAGVQPVSAKEFTRRYEQDYQDQVAERRKGRR